MASVNVQSERTKTSNFQGGPGKSFKAIEELRRIVLNMYLFEDSFYQNKDELNAKISDLVGKVKTKDLVEMAISAKEEYRLRHAPLFIAIEMLKHEQHKTSVRALLQFIIKRPDDLTELIAIYFKQNPTGGATPALANQLKRGLREAILKFNEYALGKYQAHGDVKLCDVFNLVHPKPKTKAQGKLWGKLLKGTLESPETWEKALSREGNTKEVWMKLLKEEQIPWLAFLRNLRNMITAGISISTLEKQFAKYDFKYAMPSQLMAAARHAPGLESVIEGAIKAQCESLPQLGGKTVILVDVSGSMDDKLSAKSEITRLDAATALAIYIREVCADVEVFSFSTETKQVPSRNGFALADAIKNSQSHGGTHLGQAIRSICHKYANNKFDRMIILTDEQSQDAVSLPITKKVSYLVNIAPNSVGIEEGAFKRINGFSNYTVGIMTGAINI